MTIKKYPRSYAKRMTKYYDAKARVMQEEDQRHEYKCPLCFFYYPSRDWCEKLKLKDVLKGDPVHGRLRIVHCRYYRFDYGRIE